MEGNLRKIDGKQKQNGKHLDNIITPFADHLGEKDIHFREV